MGCVIFPLYVFYSHHGLCYIPIPSWVVLYSHCIFTITIMGCVIFPLYIFMGCVVFPLYVYYSHHGFPLYIFFSHYGLFYISIVYILNIQWEYNTTHDGTSNIFPIWVCYIAIVYPLFPSWVMLYSHCIFTIPIRGCVIQWEYNTTHDGNRRYTMGMQHNS